MPQTPDARDHTPSDGMIRRLGLAAGGGALAVALVVALFGTGVPPQPPAPAQPTPVAPPASAAATATPSGAQTAPIPAFDTAMADGPPEQKRTPAPAAENPDLEFLIRFDERHPLHRAEALQLQGKQAEAEQAVRSALPHRPELAGLCFERFTLGAEIVLSVCEAVPAARAQRTSERWVKKLRAIRGVQYVDANVVLHPEAAH